MNSRALSLLLLIGSFVPLPAFAADAQEIIDIEMMRNMAAGDGIEIVTNVRSITIE